MVTKPIKYSTPKPLYITTTERPQAPTDYSHDSLSSYDYEEVVFEATTPTAEHHTVKVTTFAPDENYFKKIKVSSVIKPKYIERYEEPERFQIPLRHPIPERHPEPERHLEDQRHLEHVRFNEPTKYSEQENLKQSFNDQPQRYEPEPTRYAESIPDLRSSSIPEVLSNLQKNNILPASITPDNVDNSIKTLAKILTNIAPKPIKEHNNHANDDYDYGYDDDGNSNLH